MSAYFLTKDAEMDLIQIRQYTLNKWGKVQSLKYLQALRQTLELLATSPLLGKLRAEVKDNARSFPHASHVIYYFQHKDKLVVFGVLHKHMVPLNHLSDR